MSESLETAKQLIADCSPEERQALKLYLRELAPHPLEKEWGIDADSILTAINRSADLTRRGVRGIIAEAVFETAALPAVLARGWRLLPAPEVDTSYDAHLERGSTSARVQVKLQRSEKGVPKLFQPRYYPLSSLYVVEVQRTRNGTETFEGAARSTRPYRFGEFDILAVNMHPSSGDWKSFRYTLSSWLLSRADDAALVEIMQPVSASPDEAWTDSLETCLIWLESGERRSVLAKVLHPYRSRSKRSDQQILALE